MPAPQQQRQSPQQAVAQQNQIARSAIRARAQRMCQQVFSQTVTPANTPVLNVAPRNVGLILGFWVQVQATVSNGSAVQINLTDFGPQNVLSIIQFNDLSNNTRIQTTGWHLSNINTWKSKRPFANAMIGESGNNTGLQTTAGAYQGFDSPINYGSNWTAISAPKSIAASGTGTITMWYYVPIAYNPDGPQGMDLRGAIYANVVNATMQLFLGFAGQNGQGQVCVATGTDSTSSIYVGAAAGSIAAVTLSSATVNVYQDYLDQLPTGPQGVLLPIQDLSTIYELKYTSVSAITAGVDFPYQYANFRDFLSTNVVYVNNGTTGARGVGADINYWALQSANFTNIWKVPPQLVAIWSRQHIGADFPPGVYFMDSRVRPISTTQYGNQQLVLNASTATNNPYMLIGVEDFAIVQQLSMAGSLQAS